MEGGWTLFLLICVNGRRSELYFTICLGHTKYYVVSSCMSGGRIKSRKGKSKRTAPPEHIIYYINKNDRKINFNNSTIVTKNIYSVFRYCFSLWEPGGAETPLTDTTCVVCIRTREENWYQKSLLQTSTLLKTQMLNNQCKEIHLLY